MKTKLIVLAAALAGSTLMAAAASADLIAGWDFSQYRVDGALTLDGSTFTDSLPANYSSLDPTNNAGAESAAFGTFHIDGTNGSTNVDETSVSAAVVPTAAVPGGQPVTANQKAPAPTFGTNPFDSLSILSGEGQANTQRLGITARSAADVVFRATPGAVPTGNWTVSFGGRTVSGSANVAVAFAEDCSSYSVFDTVSLTEAETQANVTLATATANTGCVRLSLDPAAGQPIIDNVAVPEPGATAMLTTGVLGLLGLAYRRQA